MTDLEVIFVLMFKDEMIEQGIIPKDVKWDELSEEQKDKIKGFLSEKIEKQKEEKKC